MLCFRYTRDASELLHDSFAWFAMNRRPLKYLAISTAVLTLGLAWLLAPDFKFLSEEAKGGIEDFGLMFRFLYKPEAVGLQQLLTMSHMLTVAVAVFLIVPPLRRYFVYRRSIRTLTSGQLWQCYRDKGSMWRALTCAAMGALAIWMPWWVILLVFPLLFYISPFIVSDNPLSYTRDKGALIVVKGMVLAAFAGMVIQMMPFLLLIILSIAFEMIAKIDPSIRDLSPEALAIVATAIEFLLLYALALASALFMVISLLFVGAGITPKPIFMSTPGK